MFAWLAVNARALCRRRAAVDVTQSLRRVQPRQLLDWLPTLGNVLFVHEQAPTSAVCPRGLLFTESSSLRLVDTCWVMGSCVITGDGPHERCQCMDQQGRILARFHLLPDTDYVAWDELINDPGSTNIPPGLHAVSRFRPSNARVVRFYRRRMAGLTIVEQRVPDLPHSAFSQRIAERLARTEALALS